MQWFQFTWKRVNLTPFRSVALSTMLPLVGLVMVVKTIWGSPSLRMSAIAGAVLLLFLVGFQLHRIHRLYRALIPIVQTDDVMLKRTVNEVGRTFLVLLCLMIFQLHLWTIGAT